MREPVNHCHRDTQAWRPRTNCLRGDGHQFTMRHITLRNDVALADSSPFGRQQQRVGDVVDTDHFGSDAADIERQFSERSELHEHPLSGLPVGRPVRVGHIGHQGGQPVLCHVGEHQLLRLAP
jgi:hypothetical protein